MTTSIKERVLEKIERGEVSMRSRAHFALQTALVAALLALAAVLAAFVGSFALFSVRQSGADLLLGFGGRGVATFFALFPWFSLALLLALLVAIELLVRRFRLGYRTPLLVALAALALGAAALAYALAATPLHSALLDRADRGELPILGEFYEGVHAGHEGAGVYRGVVTTIAEERFGIAHEDGDRDTDDGSWTVVPPAGFDCASLHEGERVLVAGSLVATSTIQAYGVRPYER